MQSTEVDSYNQFLTDLDGKKKIEEKIRLGLDFMQKVLAEDKGSLFRHFWEAKRLCLVYFKERMPARVRTAFWMEYIELSDEARRLKKDFHEESQFAFDQIRLALQAMEEDWEKRELLLEAIELIEVPQMLEEHGQNYVQMQKELDFLQTFAGKLNGLKKELVHLSLRMCHKNPLFDKLKHLGGHIFPRRAELIREVSSLFAVDIVQFLEKDKKSSFLEQKEEIKILQNFAKSLMLAPVVFTETRQMLSERWDQIKEKEKENHLRKVEKRKAWKKNFEAMESKIKDQPIDEETIEACFNEVRELDLGHEERAALKKQLWDLKKPLEEKQKKEKERLEKAKDVEQNRQKEVQKQLLKNAQTFLDQAELLSYEALVEKWEALVKEKKAISASGIEEAALENKLDMIVDHLQEKKCRSLLEQNPEDLSSSLHTLLDERHKERRKIKEHLESHRKILGGSSLNVEESLLYQELTREEKWRLDGIETTIEEIEEKLFDLEE